MTSALTFDGEAIEGLRKRLSPLVGMQIDVLSLPSEALEQFEPSQIGTVIGTLMDACLPVLKNLPNVGIQKAPGILGEREGYPDYLHDDGMRLELKLAFVDNPEIKLKKPPTPREPSARVTQKVTVKNVVPDTDVLLVIAYRLGKSNSDPTRWVPEITQIGLFPMHEIVSIRDKRLADAGGRWFGDYETPTVPSKRGLKKIKNGESLRTESYGNKEGEGWDYNLDTNFGKLKRIPYKPLQDFLKSIGASYTSSGITSPTPSTEEGVENQLSMLE